MTISYNVYSTGIVNDFDGGQDLEIVNSAIAHVQNPHKIICGHFQPDTLLEELTEKHFASKEIKNKEAHERLKKMLTNLDPYDNPVLMIATFK